jgi:hypothetical protein
MKVEKANERRNKRGPFLWMLITAVLTLTGCASFGPLVLNSAVIKYDNNVLQSEEELLLLNIVRMHDDQPPHFTVASSVQATYLLSGTGTVAPIGTTTSAYGGTIGATINDNPTITIVPMQGKDYAERLLRPIDPHFVNTILLQQGGKRIDKMLRLIGRSFTMLGPDKSKTIFESIRLPDDNYSYPDIAYLKDVGEEVSCLLKNDGLCVETNRPQTARLKKNNPKYELFRKVVLHIRALSLTGRLQICGLDVDVPYKGTKRPNVTTKTDTTKTTTANTTITKADATKSTVEKDTITKADATKSTVEKDTITNADATKNTVKKGDPTKPDSTETTTTNNDPTKNTTKETTTTEADPTKTNATETTTTNADPTKTSATGTTTTTVIDTTKTQAVPTDGIKDTVDALEKNYYWKETPAGLTLVRHYRITTLTDFDFDSMEPKDQDKLIEKIRKVFELDEYLKFDEGIILVLVRGDQENPWPICGFFSVRNVTQVLQFLAESLNEQPGRECEYEKEYYVRPSPLTERFLEQYNKLTPINKLPPECLDNPALTLTINSSPKMIGQRPKDRFVEVDYKGESYSISCPWVQTGEPSQSKSKIEWDRPDPPRWDKEVFNMLYEMYQFNRTEPPVGPPSVTIAK